VPFDYRLIDTGLLSGPELQWLNDYHQHVLETVGPLLDAADRDWLVQATRHIGP
jgi:Xaa-Pro aminopeptidase